MAWAEWGWGVFWVVVVIMIVTYSDNSDLDYRIDELNGEVHRLRDDIYYLEEDLWYCQDGVAKAEASRIAQAKLDYSIAVWEYWQTRGQ